MTQQSLISQINAYNGGLVDRALAEVALDFMVSLEPDPDDPNGCHAYEKSTASYEPVIKKAMLILRSFGESIEPRDLETMQEVFYSFSNSLKYRATAQSIGCVRACLSSAWDGIGPWRQ